MSHIHFSNIIFALKQKLKINLNPRNLFFRLIHLLACFFVYNKLRFYPLITLFTSKRTLMGIYNNFVIFIMFPLPTVKEQMHGLMDSQSIGLCDFARVCANFLAACSQHHIPGELTQRQETLCPTWSSTAPRMCWSGCSLSWLFILLCEWSCTRRAGLTAEGCGHTHKLKGWCLLSTHTLNGVICDHPETCRVSTYTFAWI